MKSVLNEDLIYEVLSVVAEVPEGEEETASNGPQGVPEAASAAPTRNTKGN